MIKNMEWGAIAYFEQSQYGLGTTDIGINNYYNSGKRRTGCGAPAGSNSSTTCNAYNTTNGMLASTTGNIYGIYDMSGGSTDYVMGNMVYSSNTFWSNRAGFTTTPDSKYYDAYTYNTSETTQGRGRLGDATKEVLKTFGSTTGGWYDDFARMPYNGPNWIGRGGNYGLGSYSGMLTFEGVEGTAYSGNTTRAVLVYQPS